MARSTGYAIAAVVLASLLPVAGAAAAGARGTSEPPLAAIVAASPTATVAVIPDGTWRVELASLYPGDSDGSLAPDGRSIAFVSTRDGNPEVYVADTRTGEVRRLTHSPGRADRRPAWSPDGRQDRLAGRPARSGRSLRHAGGRFTQATARGRGRRRRRSRLVARRGAGRVLVEPRREASALGGRGGRWRARAARAGSREGTCARVVAGRNASGVHP